MKTIGILDITTLALSLILASSICLCCPSTVVLLDSEATVHFNVLTLYHVWVIC